MDLFENMDALTVVGEIFIAKEKINEFEKFLNAIGFDCNSYEVGKETMVLFHNPASETTIEKFEVSSGALYQVL